MFDLQSQPVTPRNTIIFSGLENLFAVSYLLVDSLLSPGLWGVVGYSGVGRREISCCDKVGKRCVKLGVSEHCSSQVVPNTLMVSLFDMKILLENEDTWWAVSSARFHSGSPGR